MALHPVIQLSRLDALTEALSEVHLGELVIRNEIAELIEKEMQAADPNVDRLTVWKRIWDTYQKAQVGR